MKNFMKKIRKALGIMSLEDQRQQLVEMRNQHSEALVAFKESEIALADFKLQALRENMENNGQLEGRAQLVELLGEIEDRINKQRARLSLINIELTVAETTLDATFASKLFDKAK